MSEEIYIYTAAFTLVGLILYSFVKWVLKGQLFHPGFIYSLINGGFFIVFAFGPYLYNAKIDLSYYYMYCIITISFVIGIRLGELKKGRRLVKDITLNRKQFLILYAILLMPMLGLLASLGISTNFNLDQAATNRLLELSVAQTERGNILQYVLTFLFISSNQIITTIFLSYAFKIKSYLQIALWVTIASLIALLQNSRSLLILNLFLMIIPFYTVIKARYGVVKLPLKKLIVLLKKTSRIALPVVTCLLILIVIITNVRTEVRSDTTVGGEQKTYELVEEFYKAEKKAWFSSALTRIPESLVNTLAEMSLYAGGTVASGGVTTRISSETGLHTWGLRNFFVVHRVLAQLKLDGGLSDEGRENFYKVMEKAVKEMPALISGWLGDPGNLMMDFGYLGAPLASLITGWLIGWLYGSLSQAGPVIDSAATSVFTVSMLLSPSVNIFGLFLSNSLNFFALLFYQLTQQYSRRRTYLNQGVSRGSNSKNIIPGQQYDMRNR